MFKSNDNTVEIQGTLVKLDALFKSYEEILRQAKDQLEGLELSAEDYTVLTRKLSTHSAFNKSVSAAAANELVKKLCSNEEEDMIVIDALVDSICKKVSEKLAKGLTSELASLVDAFMASDYVETEVEKRIANSKAAIDAMTQSSALEQLVKLAFNPDNETK